MPEEVLKVRVFLASPGDVQEERDSLPGVIEELNITAGRIYGVVLELVRWETHSHPTLGRPQGVINEQIGSYDIFIGVMWNRFGTPTGEAESGTEEEFNRAYEEWTQDNQLHVSFYFSQALSRSDSDEQDEQRAKVRKFKREIQTKGLTWDYPNASEFPGIVRRHLHKALFDMFPERIGRHGLGQLEQKGILQRRG